MPIYTEEEEDEISLTLREIVRDEGIIVGCDIVVGHVTKLCACHLENGIPQFYHIGWDTGVE